MLDEAFAQIAAGFSQAFGGPYWPANAVWPGTPVLDDGGDIVTPGTPVEADCQCQVDAATEAMRSQAGYADTDVRLLILGLSALNTDASINVLSGPSAGLWSIQSVERDPAAVGWLARGRRG